MKDEHVELEKAIIKRVDRKLARERAWFRQAFKDFREELMEDLKPLFEDFTGRAYVAKNKQGIVLDPGVLQVIKWLVGLVVFYAGGKSLLEML